MNIPKRLKIGGHWVEIRYSQDVTDRGQSDQDKLEIILSSALPQSQREAVLIHEVFHYLNSSIDHALLDSLAEQFYQVLKDNNLLK